MEKYTIAWFNVNRKCNNRCDFCYANDGLSSKKEIDISKAHRIIPILGEIGIKKIILIGGEPTLYDSLIPLIKDIKANKIECAVQTNGLRFADEKFLDSFIESEVDECCISIKGFTEERYNKITRTANYKLLKTAISNTKKKAFKMMYSHVLTDETIACAEELVAGVQNLQLPNIYISTVHPTLCEDVEYQKQQPERWIESYKYISKNLKSTSTKYMFNLNFPLCLFEENFAVDWMKRDILHKNVCQAIVGNGIVFDWEFNVIPCNTYVGKQFIKNQKEIYKVDDLIEILECGQLQNFRNAIRKPVVEKCRTCFRWTQCHSGCPLRWKHEDPNKIIKGFGY